MKKKKKKNASCDQKIPLLKYSTKFILFYFYSSSGTPSTEDCNLYYINRDTLFCHHSGSEAILQRIMALFVASHYKNTPDDLQLLSDAPAHHIFCLLGPTPANPQKIDPLCVVQVCLEGEISKKSVHGIQAKSFSVFKNHLGGILF